MLASGQVATGVATSTDAIADCSRLALLMLRAQDDDRDSFDVGKFEPWLYRIATNVALNHLRPQKSYRHNISRQRIRAAVACLPDRQRSAVLLHKYHGLDYDGIANTLGCPLQAVKSLFARMNVYVLN